MHSRRYGLRRLTLVTFVVFVVFALGSLFLSRSRSLEQMQGTNTPTKVATTTSVPASTSTAPAAISSPTPRPDPSRTQVAPTPTLSPAAAADDLLYFVDKETTIPASYAPADLVALTTIRSTTANQKVRRIILPSLEKLVADAKAAGFELVVSSAYRSYTEQESVHAYWERTLGKAEADRVSALAGHSEHQLGTTLDLTSASVGYDLDERFGSMPEGKWLRDNAYKYGFVISYPEEKEAVTGYAYEPWHIRYVEVETATNLYQKGMTLNEYLRSRR